MLLFVSYNSIFYISFDVFKGICLYTHHLFTGCKVDGNGYYLYGAVSFISVCSAGSSPSTALHSKCVCDLACYMFPIYVMGELSIISMLIICL